MSLAAPKFFFKNVRTWICYKAMFPLQFDTVTFSVAPIVAEKNVSSLCIKSFVENFD